MYDVFFEVWYYVWDFDFVCGFVWVWLVMCVCFCVFDWCVVWLWYMCLVE